MGWEADSQSETLVDNSCHNKYQELFRGTSELLTSAGLNCVQRRDSKKKKKKALDVSPKQAFQDSAPPHPYPSPLDSAAPWGELVRLLGFTENKGKKFRMKRTSCPLLLALPQRKESRSDPIPSQDPGLRTEIWIR